MDDPNQFVKRDLLNVIYPFVMCCYPRAPEVIREAYSSWSTERLVILFDTPGSLHKLMRALLESKHPFLPPKWTKINYGATSAKTEKVLLPITRVANATCPARCSPSYDPFQLMGIPKDNFTIISATGQKLQALTLLPMPLSKILSTSSVVLVMADIGVTEPIDLFAHLQSDIFLQMLWDFASSHQQQPSFYRFRYRLGHSGRGAPWPEASEGTLHKWLTALLPLLLASGKPSPCCGVLWSLTLMK